MREKKKINWRKTFWVLTGTCDYGLALDNKLLLILLNVIILGSCKNAFLKMHTRKTDARNTINVKNLLI